MRDLACASLLLGVLGCAACASTPPPVEPTEPTAEPDPEPGPAPAAALLVESEVGALDRGAVKEAFAAASPDIEACITENRRERVPLLGGTVEPVLRLGADGEVLWTYLRQSTLGDHVTEQCILRALKARSWPKPSGGKEGETAQQLDLGEPDVRPPVAWTGDDLGPSLGRLESSLRACRRRAKTGPLQVTFYVDPTADGQAGRARTAGVAKADETGGDVSSCVVRAVSAGRYPSPGSYTAKVTVEVR